MRIVRVWIIFFSVGLGVMGCAGQPEFILPVTDPTQRLEFEKFSILPPQGKQWFVAPPSLRKQGLNIIAQFFKLTTPPSKTHTVVATVMARRVPISAGSRAERVQKFAQVYSEGTNRERPISVNISPDRTLAPDCVRYDVTYEDHGVPGYPGSIFIFDGHGFVCLHPDLPDAVIDIQYSQRRLQEEPPLSLEAEGEPFVKSLLFTN